MYISSWIRGNSDCLLENKFPAKSFHSCRSTASFLLRGIRLRRSGCYRSSQNNVLSGDSSMRRGGKKLPFGDEGDEGEYGRVFLRWSKTLAQDALSRCKTSMCSFQFHFLAKNQHFYEDFTLERRCHFGRVDEQAGTANDNIADKESRCNIVISCIKSFHYSVFVPAEREKLRDTA